MLYDIFQVTSSNTSFNDSKILGLNISIPEKILESEVKSSPHLQEKDSTIINHCNASIEEPNIQQHDISERTSDITLRESTNAEEIDRKDCATFVESACQKLQDKTDNKNVTDVESSLVKESNEPNICSNLTNSVHDPASPIVKKDVETNVANEKDTTIANNDIKDTVLADTQVTDKVHLSIDESYKSSDKIEILEKICPEFETIGNIGQPNEITINQSINSEDQSLNIPASLMDKSAPEGTLLQNEKDICLEESQKQEGDIKKIENFSTSKLSSQNLLDCSLPKNEVLNLEMDQNIVRGKF